MQIYRNRRQWKLRLMLWLFALAAAGFLVMFLYGVIASNPGAMILGPIIGLIALAAFIGVEVYARHYVAALRLDGDILTVETMSIFGPRTATLAGGAAVSDEKTFGHAILDALETIDALMGEGGGGGEATNSYRTLQVPGSRKKYLIDTTADPAAGEAVAVALGRSSTPASR